jgi:YD repeat-containing protein
MTGPAPAGGCRATQHRWRAKSINTNPAAHNMPVKDRSLCVVTPDGQRWRYRYDALGRRIAKQRLDSAGRIAEQTQFTWDGANLAEEMRGGAGPAVATVWEWVPGSARASPSSTPWSRIWPARRATTRRPACTTTSTATTIPTPAATCHTTRSA